MFVYVHIYTGAFGGWTRVAGALELELQVAVSVATLHGR